jgi:hypothetical protein
MEAPSFVSASHVAVTIACSLIGSWFFAAPTTKVLISCDGVGGVPHITSVTEASPSWITVFSIIAGLLIQITILVTIYSRHVVSTSAGNSPSAVGRITTDRPGGITFA